MLDDDETDEEASEQVSASLLKKNDEFSMPSRTVSACLLVKHGRRSDADDMLVSTLFELLFSLTLALQLVTPFRPPMLR